MSKHTPGPWETVEVGYNRKRQEAKARSVVMATLEGERRRIADCRDEDTWLPEEDEANAQLIAAAPDLLEALEAIVLLGVADPALAEHWGPLFRAGQKAIAKARGV